MSETVVGYFRDSNLARAAADQLRETGSRSTNVRPDEATGDTPVSVHETAGEADRIESTLRAAGAHEVRREESAVTSSERYETAEPASFGDEGGSSQWGQRVLRVEGDETVVQERTVSRDAGSRRSD